MEHNDAKKAMVWFVGAGPGDPELITVKGLRRIQEADVVLYAGSLVPEGIALMAPEGAVIRDSSDMTLEETHSLMCAAVREGKLVVRLHTGDSGLYGAMREQKQLLDAEGIPNAIIPGVSAAFAAAAAAGVSFTVPEAVQALAVSRLHGRTPVPEGQSIREYARHGGSLAIYLSAGDPEGLVAELQAGGVAEDTPIVVASRVGWPDQRIVHTCLANIAKDMQEEGILRQAVVLVLPGEGKGQGAQSRLYAKEFSHGYRE